MLANYLLHLYKTGFAMAIKNYGRSKIHVYTLEDKEDPMTQLLLGSLMEGSRVRGH